MNASVQAQQLLRAGQVAEAERAYEHVLKQSPNDVEALNVLALAALRRREFVPALKLLDRAVSAHPADMMSRYHRGRVRDEAGDASAALADYEAAVALRADHPVARLHFASALDRTGDAQRALSEFIRALDQSQRQGRWLNAASTPAPLQPLVERAVQLVRDAKRGIAQAVLATLKAKYGAADLARVERALRVYLREEAAEPPDPRQRPTYLYFPDLPPSAYLARELFPWLGELESQTDAIRAELLQLLPSESGRERVFLNAAVESVNLRSTRPRDDMGKPSWNGYYFYRHGKRHDDNCSACPVTAAAIDSLPLPRVRDHGPEVLFSVFAPGTHLLPHRGVTNTRVVSHLPLIIPDNCALKVGGEEHAWQEGRVLVFDDTYEHEAWNRSEQLRVVLIIDIWNPYLTLIEREAMAELIAQMSQLQPLHD
jgi:aspartate beta-hydroxylase